MQAPVAGCHVPPLGESGRSSPRQRHMATSDLTFVLRSQSFHQLHSTLLSVVPPSATQTPTLRRVHHGDGTPSPLTDSSIFRASDVPAGKLIPLLSSRVTRMRLAWYAGVSPPYKRYPPRAVDDEANLSRPRRPSPSPSSSRPSTSGPTSTPPWSTSPKATSVSWCVPDTSPCPPPTIR